ncbi:MAG: glycosyltransferase [Saprospiraceae bacterium]|nr:glycosyltransferase [Saprospiraceae bacterium]
MRDKKKHIIATVTNDLSYDQRMIRICSTLVDAGYDVTLVGRKKEASVPLVERSFRQKRIRCRWEKGFMFYLEYNVKLFFYLLFKRFDILNAVDLDTLMPGHLIARLKGKPLVFDAHEYYTELPELVERKFVRRFWKRIAKFTIPKQKHCYTVGPELARIMGKEYGVDFQVVRNLPFRQEAVAKPEEGQPLTLLYQGALNEGRGLFEVIQALEERKYIQLWIAGEGDLSEFLREEVDLRWLKDRIKFLGYLQPEELKETTLKAHVGLNLLEAKGKSYYYSLANKAFDYIQAGLPSIHMNFPEYAAINKKYDVFELIDDLEKDTILHAIERLLSDPTHYKRLRSNCLIARSELNWENEKEVLLNLYKSID